MPQVLLYIAVGGAVGALLRYGLNHLMLLLLGPATLVGILGANVLGCFGIGLLYAGGEHWPGLPGQLREGLAVGLLGSFTTFSAFALQTQQLLLDGERLRALGYVLCSVVLSLVACWAGMQLPQAVRSA